MGDNYSDGKQEKGFFNRNKAVAFAIIISCMLFVFIFFMEKSKSVLNMVPMFRGEVPLAEGFVITTIRHKYPIVIKKNDPFIGRQLRFFGDIKSIFAAVADSMCNQDDIVVEVGAHFGYNVLSLGNRLRNGGKYYAYEPNISIISCLRKSVVLNDLEGVVYPRNVAISDVEGVYHLEDCLSLAQEQDDDLIAASPEAKFIDVKCSTLDKELANESKPITLLLIDIPGLEFSIIKGALGIMSRSPGIRLIVALDLDASSSSRNIDPQKELRELERSGYKLYIADAPNVYISSKIPEILARKKVVLLITKRDL
jgi:FkbM family methyltransferase